MGVHVVVQPHRVLQHPLARERRVAHRDGVHDVAVVGDRAHRAVGLVHGAAPDRADMDEQPVRDVLQHGAVPGLQDRLVEADIGLGVFLDMGARVAGLVVRDQPLERADLAVGRELGRPPCRHAFERRPDGDRLQDLVARLADDEDALPRHHLDQPLLGEPGHGLADRRARDAELAGERALVEAEVGRLVVDPRIEDRLAQLAIDMVGQAEIPPDRFERHRAGGCGCVGHVRGIPHTRCQGQEKSGR